MSKELKDKPQPDFVGSKKEAGNKLMKNLLPHLIAVVVFLIVAVIFCKPALEGKVLEQHDIIGWKGMAQQSIEFKEKYGQSPLWSNSMFSGMPAYTFALEAKQPIPTSFLNKIVSLGLPKPINFFFLACICFYFLAIVLRISPWIGILTALAYGYASFDPVIIGAGHDTQMLAIAYAPAVIASLILLFQRKYLWGAALLAIFFGFQVGTQHLQIIYYTGIIIAFLVLAYLVHSWRRKEIKSVFLPLLIAVAAAAIGFLTFAVSMFPVQEYAKATMRGGHSALTSKDTSGNTSAGGLNKDYAFNYSYGIDEISTFIVPGVYGGSNGGSEHSGSTQFTRKLSEAGVPEEQALQYVNGYSYWGGQVSAGGTSGPVYYGAVICFLFILGIVYLKTWHKWWILAATIFAILLAWGKNFSAFNYFLFDYLPLYNKFRAPTMALVIPQLTFPLTAALVLDQLLKDPQKRENLWKPFKTSVIITAVVMGIMVMLYFSFNYRGPNDNRIKDNFTAMLSQTPDGTPPTAEAQQRAAQFSSELMTSLQKDRKSVFGTDLLRSFIFIALAVLLLGAFLKNKIKPAFLLGGLFLLSTIDVFGVARRYLNEKSFVDENEFESAFTPSEADERILADPAKPFRVLDQTDQNNGPFQSSRASYFHNSIGGYSPAKLSIYQDLIEHQLNTGNMEVYNALNTKYFIVPNPQTGKPVAQINPSAFGPVWLVKAIKFVPTPDAEMASLSNTSLRDTAIVQEQFRDKIKFNPVFDSSATITHLENRNDLIKYSFKSNANQFAVFSEIYYPLGWNAYIDGQKANYVKADYVLRGLAIPSGSHNIEFRFEPRSFEIGNMLTVICGYLALLLLAAAIFFEIRKPKPLPAKRTVA